MKFLVLLILNVDVFILVTESVNFRWGEFTVPNLVSVHLFHVSRAILILGIGIDVVVMRPHAFQLSISVAT